MKNIYTLLILISTLFFTSCVEEPDVEKIKGDLLGQSMKLYNTRYWNFDSLSEFDNFTILSKTKNGDILEYIVEIAVKDERDYYNFDANIIYRKESGEWKFVSIKGKLRE